MKINNYLLISMLLIFNNCIDESIIEITTDGMVQSERLLQHIEANGNYVGSEEYPALITADELQANLQSFTIIDVRSENEFSSGHIPGSINIQKDQLFDFVNERKEEQIILVSQTGQSASYYTTLFRVLGLNKIFALRFGIGVWNDIFSSVWIDNADDKRENERYSFNAVQYPKNGFSPLPMLTEVNPDLSIEQILKERVESMVKEGFNDNILRETTFNTISFEENQSIQNRYLVCFGEDNLYNLGAKFDGDTVSGEHGHLPETPFYIAFPYEKNSLKTNLFLQTFPNDKPILLYSFSGQLSAIATAYLRLLGYDARSVLFGGHNIFHPNMFFVKGYHDFYVFWESEIKNYNFNTN